MTNTITGVVKAQRVNTDNGYISYNVKNSWFNQEFSGPKDAAPDLEGKPVEIEFEDTDDFINIVEVKNISGDRGNSGEGDSSPHISRSKQIKVNTAFQQACETVRGSGGEIDVGEHLEKVSKLTNGYYNVLNDHMKDKAEGDE